MGTQPLWLLSDANTFLLRKAETTNIRKMQIEWQDKFVDTEMIETTTQVIKNYL